MIFKIFRKIKRIIYSYYYRIIFKKVGKNFNLSKPLLINGAERIEIGTNVNIGWSAWLAAVPHTGFGNECSLIIEDGVSVGNFAHIYASKKIHIKKNVLIADKVYISDNLHGYEDITLPIIKQPIIQKNEVTIDEGSWIGEGACIIGVKIGKNCVIGANAVVTKDVPDYCVVVGVPARVIKRFDDEKNLWIKEINKNYEYFNNKGGGKLYISEIVVHLKQTSLQEIRRKIFYSQAS